MRRHAKGSSAGSIQGHGTGLMLALTLLVLGALLPAPALGAPSQVITSIPFDGAQGEAGGRFGQISDVAVNQDGGAPGDGDLFVASQNRIQQIDAGGDFIRAWGYDVVKPGGAGNVPVNEQQTVTIGTNTTGGTFTLRFGGTTAASTSVPIAWDASAATVQAALEGIAAIGAGNVAVSSSNPGGGVVGGPYTVVFQGARADANVAQMTSVATGLTVSTGSKTVTIATTVPGALAFEKCTVAESCKAGVSGLNPGQLSSNVSLAIDHDDGSIWASRFNDNRLDKFDADGDFLFGLGWDVIPVGGPNDTSEEQTATVDATGGSFTLTFSTQTTAAISYDATALAVQEALENLSNLNPGDISVSGAAGGPWTVQFTGAKKGANQPQITADPTNLIGGGQTATVVTDVEGATFTGYEICTAATGCQGGTSGPNGGQVTAPGGVAVDPRNGDALVVESVLSGTGNFRIGRFNADGSFDRVMGWDVVPGGFDGLEACTSTVVGACKEATRLFEDALNKVFERTPGKFYFQGGEDIAVDSTGAFYVTDERPHPAPRVQKFNATMTTVTELAPSELSPTEITLLQPDKRVVDVAVNLGDDHVYALRYRGDVNNFAIGSEVVELSQTGELLDVHATIAVPPTNSPEAVLPNRLTLNQDRLYLGQFDGVKRQVLVADVPQPPGAIANPATEITKTSAKLNAEVDPNGYFTDYHLEYRRKGTPAWKRIPATDLEAGSGGAPVPVSQSVSGLSPGSTYEARVVATKRYGGGVAASPPITFQALADSPGVSAAAAYQRGADGVKFVAFVDPNALPTTYRFEYGTADCETGACSSIPVPDGVVGSLADGTTVSEAVAGLSPGVTYHFRIVATNSAGTTEGPDTVFVLGTAPPEGSARAYEQISPSEKNGVDAGGSFYHHEVPGSTAAVSADGSAVAFTAAGGSFADGKVGCSVRCDYVARRATTGWVTRSITADPLPDNPEVYLNEPIAFNPDFSASVIRSSEVLAAAPDEPSGFFRMDIADESVTRIPGLASDINARKRLGWSSSSVNQIGYHSQEVLTGDGQPATGEKVYVLNNGTVELASILPDGGFPAGASIGRFFWLNTGTSSVGSKVNSISRSGRYAFFSAPEGFPAGFGGPFGPPALIYRRDLVADTTTMVSPSKRTIPDPSGSWARMFEYATPDGETVLFRSFEKLTDDATASNLFSVETFGDLYRYDIPTESLVDVSVDADKDDPLGAQVLGLVGATDDASHIYYAAQGEVVEGGQAGKPNLYMWRDDGSPDGETKFIATLDAADSDVWTSEPDGIGGYRRAAVSDNGRLVFQSAATLTGNDDDTLTQVFLYAPEGNGGAGQLHCVSCRPDGDVALGNGILPSALNRANLATSAEGGLPLVGGEITRVISDDGRTIAFESEDALVSGDVNGEKDVYEWHDGEVRAVSTGTSSADSEYQGMSKNGRDILFRTRQKLLPTDGDTLYDIYDARRGGGFPISKLPPCAGEECRPEPQDRPTVDVAGSGYFAGRGNVTEAPKARKCPKGKRQVKRRGATRCIAKRKGRQRKHRKQRKQMGKQRKQNRANANRGGAK